MHRDGQIASCAECSESDVLIRIENNTIVGVDMEATKAVTFMTEAPYVQDAELASLAKGFGVDDLVTWRDFEPRWFHQMVKTYSSEQTCEDREVLLRGLRDQYNYTTSEGSVFGTRGIAWLHCRHRHLWTREHYVRVMDYCDAHFFGPERFAPTNDTPVKSMGIVHLEYQGQPVVAGIWWGDLLDFPEYRVGDSVRWSEYSLGDPQAETVYACWWPMLDISLKETIRQKFIRIENNVIVGFDEGPEVEDALGFYDSSAHAYVGVEPYLIWPDEEVL